MLGEYAELELDPESEPMFGQLALSCDLVGAGVVVDGAVVDGVVVDGVVLPLAAAQVTPTPIVSAAMTTNRTILIRAIATSFQSQPSKQPNMRKGSETPVNPRTSRGAVSHGR